MSRRGAKLTEPVVLSVTSRDATLPAGTPLTAIIMDEGTILVPTRDYTRSGLTITLTYDPADSTNGITATWVEDGQVY